MIREPSYNDLKHLSISMGAHMSFLMTADVSSTGLDIITYV